ncbi:DUF1127 domain-containing protein [Pseudomonas borbori]
MNGLSDVRLTLLQDELDENGQSRLTRAAVPSKGRWAQYWRRLSTRRALLNLNDAQLKDIGLTRAQARREALRPFWTL